MPSINSIAEKIDSAIDVISSRIISSPKINHGSEWSTCDADGSVQTSKGNDTDHLACPKCFHLAQKNCRECTMAIMQILWDQRLSISMLH